MAPAWPAKRRGRGPRLNCPEADRRDAARVLEGARDGRSVTDLIEGLAVLPLAGLGRRGDRYCP